MGVLTRPTHDLTDLVRPSTHGLFSFMPAQRLLYITYTKSLFSIRVQLQNIKIEITGRIFFIHMYKHILNKFKF